MVSALLHIAVQIACIYAAASIFSTENDCFQLSNFDAKTYPQTYSRALATTCNNCKYRTGNQSWARTLAGSVTSIGITVIQFLVAPNSDRCSPDIRVI